jgi:hypothetical protein
MNVFNSAQFLILQIIYTGHSAYCQGKEAMMEWASSYDGGGGGEIKKKKNFYRKTTLKKTNVFAKKGLQFKT